MILSEQHKAKIRELFPEECERLLAIEDVKELLRYLDDVTYALLDDDYGTTAESDVVERLRDSIDWLNAYGE